ncbi:MAG: hypothetical protein V4556_07000 [Bacteroidota bacterium]
MKKILLLFIVSFLYASASFADFGISASAVYLDINGSSAFYNTQRSATLPPIGSINLNAQLGVFGSNSGNLKLIGAELRTIKNNTGSVCGGNLFYAVYPQGIRPTTVNFSSINLAIFCSCNGSTYNSCGGGVCNNINEQKLQNISKSVDLTAFQAGVYTLEIYYEASGDETSGNCTLQELDNAGGDNYKADFTISEPLSVNYKGFGAICTDNSIKLKWSIENDLDIEKYEIEKSSTGLLFTSIGEVMANSTGTLNYYSFFDKDPLVGTNYYRMKVHHKNTGVNISSIVRIYFGKIGNTIFIYPNPSGSVLAVRFAAVNKGHYQMNVLGNNGQTITTFPVEHDGTDKTIRIPMPVTLPKGIYRLFLIDKERFYKQAFLIK